MSLQLAHIGHYASLLYALPVVLLFAWAGCARVARWWRGRDRD